MAKLSLLAGSTSVSVQVFIQNSSVSTGAGLTGLAYNTASLVASYVQPAGSRTAITLATLAAANSAWSSGGFKEIDATNCPGLYRLDIPNAALTGATHVTIHLKGAANMVPCLLEVELVAYNPFDAVRLGLTALPNAAAEASGGLFTRGTGAGQINQDGNGRIDVNLKAILGTVLTETTGYIAAAFKKLFNVATPTAQADNLPLNTDYTAARAAKIDYLTGDAFARIGAAGAGLSALGDTRLANLDAAVSSRASDANMATLLARLTSTRAALLDNLNVGGLVASSAEAASVQNNTRVVRVVPAQIERPDAGSITIPIELLLYDSVGNMEAPDAAPTLVVLGSDGTDLSSRLDSGTMALVATGRYRAILTVAVADTLDALRFVFSVVEGGATRVYVNASWIVDTTAVDFTSADRSDLQAAKASAAAIQAKLPAGGATIGDATEANVSARATPAQVASALATYDGPTNAEMEARTLAAAAYSTASAVATLQSAIDALNNLSSVQAQAAAAAALAAYDPPTNAEMEARTLPTASYATASALSTAAANVATLLGKFTGITLLAQWLGLIAGKQVGDTTARNEIRATGAGSGTFNETTDSVEAIRDRGDAAWTTGSGGGSGGMALTDAVPTSPAASSVGEALAASLHWRLGKKVLTDNGDGTYTLRTYRAHATEFTAETLWHEETLNHPTAPSEVTPA